MSSNFLPWYNKNLIEFLEHILMPQMNIFEYGGGNSTLYYSSKVARVCTIETKKEWFEFVLENQKLSNIEIKLCQNLTNFSEEIENFSIKLFDIIIIDSRDRANCLMKSISFLNNGGMIILDNSERENLKQARAEIVSLGFFETIFSGERFNEDFSTSSVFTFYQLNRP